MFTDIAFPKNNEAEFLKIAKELGIKEICFVYPKGKDCFKSELIVMHKTPGRDIFERKVDCAFELECTQFKDSVNAKNSGLNQVTAKLALKNKILIGFSFSSLLQKRSVRIGRMKQNIKLCRKYKLPAVVASFARKPYELRSESDLKSLMINLGAHPKEAKDMTQNLNKRIILNKKIQKGTAISEGIEVV